jgi:imidazolonepropionase-like amidohydrolase
MLIAYRAARVIDGVSEGIIEDAAVVVQDDRIVAVTAANGLPARAEPVELGDATLLPGLIDAHVHLTWSASAEPHEMVSRESRALTALRCAANAALHLRAGVTTVRDVGATDGLWVRDREGRRAGNPTRPQDRRRGPGYRYDRRVRMVPGAGGGRSRGCQARGAQRNSRPGQVA